MRGVDSIYTSYFLQSRAQDILHTCKKDGTTVASIDSDRLAAYEVAIAPAAEQKRIVSKIDELFSRIDEGERALERVRKLVERYRQSVLKAAVTGELTREWREKNKDKLESGEALFARILKARREAWEKAELEKMKAKGITPANDKWKERYESAAPPLVGLADVPEFWAQPSLEQVTRADRPIAYGVLQPGPDVPDGVLLVRVCNVADGVVDLSNLKKIDTGIAAVFPRTRLFGGEVLLTLVGTVGRTGVVPQQLAGANVARAVGVLVPNEGITAAWLEVCLRHEKTRQLLVGSSREVARKTLNLEQLREVAIPVPSPEEQRDVLSRLDQELSRIAAVEETLVQQVRMSTALRQATLKAAFAGQLVGRDPADEPASALLERIAAVRGTDTAAPNRGRKSPLSPDPSPARGEG